MCACDIHEHLYMLLSSITLLSFQTSCVSYCTRPRLLSMHGKTTNLREISTCQSDHHSLNILPTCYDMSYNYYAYFYLGCANLSIKTIFHKG